MEENVKQTKKRGRPRINLDFTNIILQLPKEYLSKLKSNGPVNPQIRAAIESYLQTR